MTFLVTVAADDLSLVGAILGHMAFLTTVSAGTGSTTSSCAILAEVTN